MQSNGGGEITMVAPLSFTQSSFPACVACITDVLCSEIVCFWLTKRNKPKWVEKGEIIGAERGRRVLGRVTGLRRGRPPVGLRSWHPAVFITLLCEGHTHTCTHCCGHHSVGVWPEPDGHRSLFLLLSFSVMSTLNQRFSHQKNQECCQYTFQSGCFLYH